MRKTFILFRFSRESSNNPDVVVWMSVTLRLRLNSARLLAHTHVCCASSIPI